MSRARIAVIGDYNPEVPAHRGIPPALERAAAATGVTLEQEWIETIRLSEPADAVLADFSGVWCAPASPYRHMAGALAAIRFAREQGRAFLGTCGGFQHALIEHLRNALGQAEADHAESNPKTGMPVITPLVCALVEQSGEIGFTPGSKLAAILGAGPIREEYRCSYGFNAAYRALIDASELQFTGFDPDGAPRAFEHTAHPFFVGVLFQPERSALAGRDHALIQAFVAAAAA